MKRNVILCVAMLTAGLAQAQDALPVQIVTAQATPQTRLYGLTGTVQASDSFAAGFRDGGRIIEVNVDIGDRVEAGDVIARVDPTRAEAAARAAQAALDAATATLVQAQQARDRAEKLRQRGTGTQADLDAATQAFISARSSRDQAEAQLKKARRAADDTVLRVVEDTIVIERSAEPGQVMGAGQPVVTLANRDGREAVFYAPNRPGLTQMLGVPLQLSAVDGPVRVTAAITEISPVVSSNGTVEVRVTIPTDKAAQFTIGEPIVGQVAVSSPPLVSLPWTALTADAQGPAVWMVDPADMTVHLAPVVIQTYSRDSFELTGGVRDGDLVVGDGSHTLFEGRHVEQSGVSQ